MADDEALLLALRAPRVGDTDVRRLSQVPHGLRYRADVQLEAASDADVTEDAAAMVEKEEENALRRTAVVIRLEPGDERSSTANGALGTRFAQGHLMAGRGQRDVNTLKAELELEGEAGTAELLIGIWPRNARISSTSLPIASAPRENYPGANKVPRENSGDGNAGPRRSDVAVMAEQA